MKGIGLRIVGMGLLALALGAGGADTAAAQERAIRWVGFIAAGGSGIATGELDDRLEARGYPEFGRAAAAVGLGAYGLLPGGVMLGGEWHGLIIGEEEHQGRTVGLGGGYATLGAGYSVELSRRARVYPRLGIGVGGMGLWIESARGVGFDEVLADPDRQAELADSAPSAVLSRGGAVLDLGAGAELWPGGWGEGLTIGLRAGYLAAPFGWGWGLMGSTVSGGPAASIGGPYFRVTVGAGWRR